MAQTSTLMKFHLWKHTAKLLLLLLFCFAGVTDSIGQTSTVATLPTSHEGPWAPTAINKAGWSSSGVTDKANINLGGSTTGGSANMITPGSYIEVNFDDVALYTSFYLTADVVRGSFGEVVVKVTEYLGSTIIKKSEWTYTKATPVNKEEFISLNLNPSTRRVRIELAEALRGAITIDDVKILKAVPKINIKQGNTDILPSSGVYAFEKTPVGSQSAPVVFTIENSGTADLRLTNSPSIQLSGVNPDDFILDFSNTNNVIAPGASTTFSVSFKPTNDATRSATISIANNDAEINPYTFTVTGEAVFCPEITSLDAYEGMAGSWIYIYGVHLDKVTRVTIGGVDVVTFYPNADFVDVLVPTGALPGPVVVYSADCSSQNEVEFNVLTPIITLSKAQINMSANVGESVIEQYQVSAEYLDEEASIGISLDDDAGHFLISKTANGPFTKTLTITGDYVEEYDEDGFILLKRTLAPVDIWVKYSPMLAGNTTATITHETSNAEAKVLTINATATGTLRPIITISKTEMTLSAAVGSSVTDNYQVSAMYLNAGANVVVDVTALSNIYGVSRNQEGPFVKTISFEVGQDIFDNAMQPTAVWVQYKPTAAGSTSTTIEHSSEGAITRILTVNGSITPIPLPVELISFNAVKQSSAVLLTWATASEQDNDFFDIEMTENMKGEFKAVGRVHSKVNTSSIKQNYQFSHKGNFTGTRYYRLKQVDLDGTFEYSKVVAVSANGMHMAAEPRVYPNPITPDSKLVYTADVAGKLIVTVVNMSGTRIQSKSYDVEAGENTIVLNLSDNLPAGIYILMTEFNGKTQQVKLIKQ
jgi:hypothetical protein